MKPEVTTINMRNAINTEKLALIQEMIKDQPITIGSVCGNMLCFAALLESGSYTISYKDKQRDEKRTLTDVKQIRQMAAFILEIKKIMSAKEEL